MSVGIILSAPMGPIGILVIQRTMEKGRKSGLYTGYGAALSDLFYCLLAGLGLSFVTDFITAHQDLFQIGGSIILIIFALFMIFRSPVKGIKHDDGKKINYTHDAITGFAFTLSNPLIIFLIFPLFARFGFPSSEYHFYHYIIGYLFIVIGAVLWWMAPSPYVTNNHQYKNAKELEDRGACRIIQEEEFSKEKVLEEIDFVLTDQKTYDKMKENSRKLGKTNSATHIYEEIKKLINNK